MPAIISVYQAKRLMEENKRLHQVTPGKDKDIDTYITTLIGRLIPCYLIVHDEYDNEIAICRPVFVLKFQIPNIKKPKYAIADLAWGTEGQGIFSYEANVKLMATIEGDDPIFFLRDEYERIQNIRKLMKYNSFVTIH